ncbi:MAG: hypothetical protein AB1798_11605, partial [Spirochaetota bacterium]
MAYITIGDLLDRAQQFEERLKTYYASIRDQSRDNGVRLLTYYLSRHRNHLQQAMKDYSSQKIHAIRAVRLKYDINFTPEEEFTLIKTPPQEVRAKELLEAAAEYDSNLITFYKTIHQQPLIDEVRALFESLI